MNMGRAQGDYFQATRGGGHGDYRHRARADGRARGGRARAAGVPPRRQVAKPGDVLRRLLPGAHLKSVDVATGRVRAGARQGLGARRHSRRQRSGQGRVAARRLQAARRCRLRHGRLLPAMRGTTAGDGRPVSSRWSSPGTSTTPSGRRRVRHAGQVHPLHRAPAARRGAPGRLRAPDHAVPVPESALFAGHRRARAASRSTRTTAARWSTTCASPCSGGLPSSSSAGSASTRRRFGIAPDFEVRHLRRTMEAAVRRTAGAPES